MPSLRRRRSRPSRRGQDLRPSQPSPETRRALPRWDADARELWLGSVLIKRFVVPASGQELVLTALEAAGWPRRLPDPFPPGGPVEPGQRLHDTVKRLNLAQQNPLLRFSRDGTGRGLRWDYCDASRRKRPSKKSTRKRISRRPR
jgi:hypothetical protein